MTKSDGGSRSEHYHNKGQEDASHGKYDPPHSSIESEVRQIIGGESDQEREDRSSYDSGHHHTSSQKGGCFLTSACAVHAGLADDCHELTVLRHFRDDFVAHLPNGEALIAEYYLDAPRIVARIEESPRRLEAFRTIFQTIQSIVALVESRRRSQALEEYITLLRGLKATYGLA